MMMSAMANVCRNKLFYLNVDVVPRINRSLETGIFFWRRIFLGRASADGGRLLENRRQRIVENPSRSMRLRDKLTPFFVWLHHRAFGKADCAAMCSSIVAAAESKAVLWTSSSGATDTNLVPPVRNLLPTPVAASGDKKISVSTLIASSTRIVEIETVYSRYLYCGTCVPRLTAPDESRRRGPRGQLMTLCGDHDAPASEDLSECLRILVLRRSKFSHVNECRVFRIKDRKFEAGVVLKILYFASQRLERSRGFKLDVVHGKSLHALPRLVSADWCDDPTVRSTLGLRNRCGASQ